MIKEQIPLKLLNPAQHQLLKDRSYIRKLRKQYGDLQTLTCRECKCEFKQRTRKQTNFCGSRCGNRYSNRLRPSDSHRSRARKHATIYEPFKHKDVFESFGWKCFLCNTHTDKPHLDHWVPSVAGGAYARFNAVCLCDTCNIIKGDVVLPVPVELLNRLSMSDRRRLQVNHHQALAYLLSERGQAACQQSARLAVRFESRYTQYNPWRRWVPGHGVPSHSTE